MRTQAMILAALLASCGGNRPQVEEPEAEVLDLEITDIVVPGEALVARTSMDALRASPLTRVLLEGLERQSVSRVPGLARALDEVERAALDDADEILITGRGLDESSGLLAVGVSYEGEVDWFEDFVGAFHGGEPDEGDMARLDGGAVMGVLVRDTRQAYGSDLRAAVCAVRFTPHLVAYVAAPDPGECSVWAGWVIARNKGDAELLGKLEEAPTIGGAAPPLAVYVDGEAFSSLCCAPFGLAKLLGSVDEAWIGLDPGAPATVRMVAGYENETMARMDRDAIAQMMDAYAPTVRLLVPGLGAALDGMLLEVNGSTLTMQMSVDAQTLVVLSDLLGTML